MTEQDERMTPAESAREEVENNWRNLENATEGVDRYLTELRSSLGAIHADCVTLKNRNLQLHTELTVLRRQNAMLSEAATWRSVKDELPELEVNVLTCVVEPGFTRTARNSMVHVNYLDHPEHWARGRRVTHWMPLPEAPKEAGA